MRASNLLRQLNSSMGKTDKIRILITGAGTASAVTVIKSLKSQNELEITTIAGDPDPMAPGLHLAEEKIILPKLSSTGYINDLLKICRDNKINVLIPAYSKELSLISTNVRSLSNEGVRTLMHPIGSIDLCNNKLAFASFLQKRNILTPMTFNSNNIKEDPPNFPLFAKPNTGSSSTGTFKIDTEDELEASLSKYPDKIYQQFIDGEEYTIDVLSDTGGKPIVISPRQRLSTKAGQSVKAVTVEDYAMNEIVKSICQEIRFNGPLNVQVIKNGNKYYLIEINPRFAAGGLGLTIAAGANIPLLAVKLILGLPISENECVVKSGVKMTRYWQEIIF